MAQSGTVDDVRGTDVSSCATCVGDDIKSTVSDSWSTDVLASDSEPPELNQLDRLEEVVEEPPSLLSVHGIVEERGHLLGSHEVRVTA